MVDVDVDASAARRVDGIKRACSLFALPAFAFACGAAQPHAPVTPTFVFIDSV